MVSLFALGAASPVPGFAGELEHRVDPETGIESWELRGKGIGLSLVQLLPDQARAFFLARGFDRESVERYAATCVFQTTFRNDSVNSTVSVRLADWRAVSGAHAQRPKLERDWQTEWEGRGIPEPARIAFRWSQFPTEQSFERGDWNMGMTTYALPPGSRFDLWFVWTAGSKRYQSIVKEVRCATEDRH